MASDLPKAAERLTDLRERDLARDPAFAEAHRASARKRALARQLVRMRTAAGLSLRELARRADWSPSFVSRLESAGGAYPKPQTIARYLKTCRPDLVTGVVFALPQEGGLQVVGGVTLDAPGEAGDYFERVRDGELALDEAEAARPLPLVGQI